MVPEPVGGGSHAPTGRSHVLFLLTLKHSCNPELFSRRSGVRKADAGSRWKGPRRVRTPGREEFARDSQKGWSPRPSRSGALRVPASSGPAGVGPRSLSAPPSPGEGHLARSPASARECPVTVTKETRVGLADPRTGPAWTDVRTKGPTSGQRGAGTFTKLAFHSGQCFCSFHMIWKRSLFILSEN